MVKIISTEDGTLLCNQLNAVYYSIIIDEVPVNNENEFIKTIISVVEQCNQENNDILKDNPNTSFMLDPTNKLTTIFISKVNNIIEGAYILACKSEKYVQNTSDIVAIIVPYILLQVQIPSNEASMFTGLACVLAKIVVSWLSSRHNEKQQLSKDELSKDEFVKFCELNIKFMQEMNEFMQEMNEAHNETEIRSFIERNQDVISKISE